MSASRRADIIRIKASINELLQDFERRSPILAYNEKERRQRYEEITSVAPELQPLLTDIDAIQKSRQVELSLVRNLSKYLQSLENTPEGENIPINREELVSRYEQYKKDQRDAKTKRSRFRIPFTKEQEPPTIVQQTPSQATSPTFNAQMNVEQALIGIATDWVKTNADKVKGEIKEAERGIVEAIREVRIETPTSITPSQFQAKVEEKLSSRGFNPELVQTIAAQSQEAIEQAQGTSQAQSDFARSAQDAAEETLDALRQSANSAAGQQPATQTTSPEVAGSSTAGFAVKRVLAHLRGQAQEEQMLIDAGANITIGDEVYAEAKEISRKVAGVASTLSPDAPLEEVVRTTQETAREQVQRITKPEVRQQLINDAGELSPQGQQVAQTIATAAAGGILLSKEDRWREETPEAVNRTLNAAIAQTIDAMQAAQAASPTPGSKDFSDNARQQFTSNYLEDTHTLTTLENHQTLIPQVQAAITELLNRGNQTTQTSDQSPTIKPTSTAFEIEDALETSLLGIVQDDSARETIVGAATQAILNTQRKYNIEPVFESNISARSETLVARLSEQLRDKNITLTPEQTAALSKNTEQQLQSLAIQPHIQPQDTIDKVQKSITQNIVQIISNNQADPNTPPPGVQIINALGINVDDTARTQLEQRVEHHIQSNSTFGQIMDDIRTITGQQQHAPTVLTEIREVITDAQKEYAQNQSVRTLAEQTVNTEVTRLREQAQTFSDLEDISRKQAYAAGFGLSPKESMYTDRTDNWQRARVARELLSPLTKSDDPNTAGDAAKLILSDNNEGRVRLANDARQELKDYLSKRAESRTFAKEKYRELRGLNAQLEAAVAAGDQRAVANIELQIAQAERDIELKKTELAAKGQQILIEYRDIINDSATLRADSLTDSMLRMAESGQWNDNNAKEEFNKYYLQRQQLKQTIEDEQQYNRQAAQDAKQQILELDKEFFSKKEILDSYYESGTIKSVQDRAFDLQNNASTEDHRQWVSTIQDTFTAGKPSGQLSVQEQAELAQKATEWTVLQRSPEYLKDVKERLSSGELTYQKALEEITSTTNRQQEIHDTYHKTATDVELMGTDKVPEDLMSVLLLRALPAKDGMYDEPAALRDAARDMAIKVKEKFSLPEEQIKPLENAYQQILQDHPNLSLEQIQEKVEQATKIHAAQFYIETAQLDKNIQLGGNLVKNQTLDAIKTALGQSMVEAENIRTEQDAEKEFVKRFGWNELDKRKAEAGIEFSALKELRVELTKDEMRGTYEQSYRMFATAVANDVLTLHSVDPNDLPVEIRRVMLQKFDEFFPEDSQLYSRDELKTLRQNFLLQLDGKVQAIINAQELNPALTAAKSRESVIPLLLYGNQQHEAQEGFLQFLDRETGVRSPQETVGLRPLTWEERVRRDLREDYRIKTQDLIISMGIDATLAENLASAITINSFGKLTVEYKEGSGDPYWKETFGKKVKAKKFNMLELAMLEKMSPSERKKWLDENPDRDEQIFLGMLNLGLASVNQGNLKGKLSPDQIKQLRTMLRNYYNQDKANKKIFNDQIAQEDTTPSELALAKAGVIGNYAFLRANYIESRIRATPYRMVNGMISLLPGRLSTDYEYGLSLLINPARATKQLNTELTIMLKTNRLMQHSGTIQDLLKNGMNLDEAIKKGLLPKLSYFQKQQLLELQVKFKTVNKVSEYLSKHPQLAAILKARAEFFGKDSTQFLKDIATSDDPINLTLSYGTRYIINKAKLKLLPKYFEYDPLSKRVVFNPLYRWKQKQLDDLRHGREKVFRWVSNSWVGKKVKGAVVNGIVAPIKKLISKLPQWLLGFLAQVVLPGIGTAIKLLWKILGIGPLKYIRDAIVLFLTFIVARIFAFIIQIGIALFQFGLALYQGALALGTALGGIGSWFSKAFTPTFSSTAPIQLSLPTGIGSSVLVSNGFQMFMSSAGTLFKGLLNLNFSSIFSAMSASLNVFSGFIKALFAGGWPGAYTLMAVSFTTVGAIVFQESILAALREGPEPLGATTITTTPTNPVRIQKEALDSPSGQFVPGDVVKYQLTATAPACDKQFVITDSLPQYLTYDPSVPASYLTIDPNGPIESITVDATPPIPPNLITWTVTLKDGSFVGPCSNASGTILGGGDLRNWQFLTVDEIRNLLLSPRVAQSPLRAEAGRYANLIAQIAQETQINPALILGILYHEGGIGSNGPGMDAPPGDRTRNSADANRFGCRNLGNQRPGTIAWSSGAYRNNPRCLFGANNDNEFAYYPSYDASIRATFAVINSYLNGGLDTIEELANRYSPASDCSEGCATGERYNREWKQTVSYTLRFKDFGNDGNIYEFGGGTTVAGFVNVTLTYQAIIDTAIPNGKGCLINNATATIGPNSSNPLTNRAREFVSVGGEPCGFGDAPDNWTEVLCGAPYYICPTVSTAHPPRSEVWPEVVKQAVWNVVQKIYMDDTGTYKQFVVQNIGLEVQRSFCWGIPGDGTYPLTCGGTISGFHAGISPYWRTATILPGKAPRITILTDAAVNRFGDNLDLWEWLIAHEIAHAASFGFTSPDGMGKTVSRADNTAYNNLNDCVNRDQDGNYVSNYGALLISENNAEAISFFMTNGETAKSDYRGRQDNMRLDFLCHYSRTRDGFFGGYEGSNYE